MSDIAQRIDTDEIEALRVSQWDSAPRLQALIRELLAVVHESLTQPLIDLENKQRLDLADGVWLDRIGERVGCIRPSVADASFARFGFDAAGVGFDQGPFDTAIAALAARVPLGDDYYRCLMTVCSHAILTDGSVPMLNHMLQACGFPSGWVEDHVDGSVTVHNVADDPRPNIGAVAMPMIRAAIPAGIAVTFAT